MVSGMNFVHHISKGFRDIGGYTPSITHTMAHELGHGLFGLDHIFSGAYGIKKGATYNLMDYTEKTPNDALSYHEWTQINLPLPSWSALSRAEEDMILKMKSTTIIEALKQSNEYGENKRIVLQLGGWDPEYLSGPIGFNTDGFAYCKPLVDKRSGLFNYRVSCSSYSNFGISELSSELFVISSNYKERNFVNNDVIYKFEILEKKDKIFPIIPNECVTITLPSEMYRYFEAYVYGTELSVSEISEIRNDIAAMPSTTEAEKAAKEQAYLDLQWVVPYHSQRDNISLDTVLYRKSTQYNIHGDVISEEDGDYKVVYSFNDNRELNSKIEFIGEVWKAEWENQNGELIKIEEWKKEKGMWKRKSKSDWKKPSYNKYFTLDRKHYYPSKQFWFTKSIEKENMPTMYRGNYYFNEVKYSENECMKENIECKKEETKTVFYAGKIGDIMCNLTSLAMNFSYLGIDKDYFNQVCSSCLTNCNSFNQLEDYLECAREINGYGNRTVFQTWKRIANLFGITYATAHSKPRKFLGKDGKEYSRYQKFGEIENLSAFIKEVNGYLGTGNSVQMSVWTSKGHIVRIVAISYEGIVVDDPYGNVIRTKTLGTSPFKTGFDYRESGNSGGYIKNTSRNNKGRHNLWRWEEIKNVTFKGIFVFNK
mgnify:CR=1 FL=1